MQFFCHVRWTLAVLLGLALTAFLLALTQPQPVPSVAVVASSFSLTVTSPPMQGGARIANTGVQTTASCLHPGSAPDLTKQEFGWNVSYLNTKYLKTTLCDDTLLAMTTVLCQPANQLFLKIGWPQDLLKEPYGSQVVCTKVHQPVPTPTPLPTANCAFAAIIPYSPVNFCAILSQVGQAVAGNFTQGVQTVATQTEALIDGVPASWTYQNSAVTAMWATMVVAVDMLVGMIILWTGLRYMLSGTNAVEYSSIIEVLPRLALTLFVVHFSLTLSQFVIDFFNALCSVVQGSLIPSVLIGSNNNLEVFAGFLGMFHSFLALFLILQAALEIAGIVVMIPLGPLCLLCLFHPDTARIARTWISTFGALCMMRFLQVLCLVLGEQMLAAGFLNSMPDAEMMNLVLGIGILGIAAMIPGILRQWVLVPIAGGGSMVTSAFSTAATYFLIGGRS
jgi:hypothetical protein